jgi:pyruvate dehydrogenase E2 component (dihydrolipoamide acetyltransferase)
MSAQPALNSVWQDDEILQMASVDIGMVVDTENGLHIPVLRDVSNCSVYDVARSSRALGKRARAGELDLAEMQGGTMSISNVGMFGQVSLVPIINPGQSAIVGVGAPSGVFRPDEEGNPILRQEAPIVLSCDHRIYDGVMAAKLLAAICEDLAKPEKILGASSPAEQ